MTYLEALDHPRLARHLSLGRLRALCADDNPDPEQREGYRALVIVLAGGEVAVPERPAAPPYDTSWIRPCGSCP